jgi:hypothetical protein
LLKKPAGDGAVLQGQVQIDAHYLLSTGKGKLIGQAGGNLIGQAGGNVIAVGGGNLIGQAGGNLIGQAGGNLIGQAGGNLIASDAANLIGQAGGNLIGKRKYDLLQAATADLTLGQTLPASEMLLQVVSMVTGKPLSIGKDAAGKDIFGIYTNATGHYTIYLPPTVKGNNVLLVAVPPNYLEDRLNYQVVQPIASTTQRGVDEDTALLSDYLREAFASRIERAFEEASETTGPVTLLGDEVPEALRPAVAAKLQVLLDAGKTATAANRRERALKTADVFLAIIDLEKVKVQGSDALMMDVLRTMLTEMRQKTLLKMNDPAYFPNLDYIKAANDALKAKSDAAGTPYAPFEIKKPTDLADYVRKDILASSQPGQTERLEHVFESVDMPVSYGKQLSTAMSGLLTQIGILVIKPPAEGEIDPIAEAKKAAAGE